MLMKTSVAKNRGWQQTVRCICLGDNFLDSLDLSASALAIGTQLRLGTA